MDNSRAENALRLFVVGRKNWPFSVSPKGARASAILYSIAATACANGMNIEEYFTRAARSEQNYSCLDNDNIFAPVLTDV